MEVCNSVADLFSQVQVIATLDGEMGVVFIIAEGGRLNWIL